MGLVTATLTGTDLTGQDLTRYGFAGLDLSRTILVDADLSGVNLSGANLTDATLTGADLTGADLTRAKLNGANLTRADLRNADYANAILSGAVWSSTVCTDGVTKNSNCRGSLIGGQSLQVDDVLTSPNLVFSLTLQGDGNLVLYQYYPESGRRIARWSSKTAGRAVTEARLQAEDGNFVIYNNDDPVWDTKTSGVGPLVLSVTDDGALVLSDRNGVLWFETSRPSCLVSV